jgi:type II secretion system protein N
MALAPKNNKWFGYGLYVILVALVLLYYLFPSQAVEDLVSSSLSRVEPHLGLKADSIRPWLPPGLKVSNGSIYLSTNPGQPIFSADSLYLRPQIFKLLKGSYNLDFSGTAYRGDVAGSLILEDQQGDVFNTELSLKDLDLGVYQLLAEELPHKLSGMFTGDIIYARDSANAVAQGTANLRLTDGQLQFEKPIFNIASVDLRKIEIDLELRDRNVTIVKGELSGTELNASLAGSIQLQPDIKNSELNLKGNLEPLAEFYRKYPEIRELLKTMKKRVKRGQYFFAITGTLGQPRLRLL